MSKRDYDTMSYRKFTGKSELDKAVNTLVGILIGMASDKVVSKDEIEELNHWSSLYRNTLIKPPYSELLTTIENYLSDGNLDQEEIEDVLWLCNNLRGENSYYDAATMDIQILQGMLHGILADNYISDDEIKTLKNWLEDNEHLASLYPYDEIYSLIITALKDGKIDDTERDTFKLFFSEFIDTKESYSLNEIELQKLKKIIKINGICSVCPEIHFQDNSFCFTGASTKATRSDIADIVTKLGGKFTDSVTKKTNYLVIGAEGNPCWAFACYGRKVEKAMDLRKQGVNIILVHENDFWDTVRDHMDITFDKNKKVLKNENSSITVYDDETIDLF